LVILKRALPFATLANDEYVAVVVSTVAVKAAGFKYSQWICVVWGGITD